MKSLKRLAFFSLLLFAFGCAKQEKRPEAMSFNELKNKAALLVEKKYEKEAIVYLEQLISQYPENQDIFEYKFMLADLYLKVGRLEEAYSLYKHYTEFYPADMRAEEAHYKSVLSKFYQTLKVSKNCDDTDAKQTLERCDAYMGDARFGRYRNDVRDIKYTCERRLIDKEVYVFDTYLRRKKYQSAKNRLDYLRKTFLPAHASLEPQILYLEGKLASKQKDHDLAKQKAEQLFDKYPESRFTKMAHGLVTKKQGFVF
jgi:outer membrane assembly lipoprotein YfiO